MCLRIAADVAHTIRHDADQITWLRIVSASAVTARRLIPMTARSPVLIAFICIKIKVWVALLLGHWPWVRGCPPIYTTWYLLCLPLFCKDGCGLSLRSLETICHKSSSLESARSLRHGCQAAPEWMQFLMLCSRWWVIGDWCVTWLCYPCYCLSSFCSVALCPVDSPCGESKFRGIWPDGSIAVLLQGNGKGVIDFHFQNWCP